MADAPFMTIADIRTQMEVAQALAKIQQPFIVVPVSSILEMVTTASTAVERFGIIERLTQAELEAELNERQ